MNRRTPKTEKLLSKSTSQKLAPIKYSVLEASKYVLTKTLLLKHCYRCQENLWVISFHAHTWPFNNITCKEHFWALILGSVHKSHVAHCESRNYTWKTSFRVTMEGSAIAEKTLGEDCFRPHYRKYVMFHKGLRDKAQT